jgi:hypothetical protein
MNLSVKAETNYMIHQKSGGQAHQKDGGQVGKIISHNKILEKISEGHMSSLSKKYDELIPQGGRRQL